jgi:hypothetical protein
MESQYKYIKKTCLDVEVSVYANCQSTHPVKSAPLYKLLFPNDSFKDKYLPIIHEIRQTTDQNRKQALKIKHLPCFTVSGTYEDRTKLLRSSGLLVVDVDKVNQHEIENAKDYLMNLPGAVYSAKSVSGKGVFAIYRIINPERYQALYRGLAHHINNDLIEGENISFLNVDASVSHPNSLRFISYDPRPLYDTTYLNDDYDYWQEEYVEPIKTIDKSKHGTRNGDPLKKKISDLEAVIEQIEFEQIALIDEPNKYIKWFKTALSIATELGEAGRSYFHAISCMTSNYDYARNETMYNNALKTVQTKGTKTGLGYVFKLAQDNGLKPYRVKIKFD